MTVLIAETLDEAWAAAEAALPNGTCDLVVYHYDDGPPTHATGPYGWYAPHQEPAKYAAKTVLYPTAEEVYGYGDSPAAALRSLVAALPSPSPSPKESTP